MKKSIFILLLLFGFCSLSFANYQDEIKALTSRLQLFAESDAGLNDSERFAEIVKMTYEYTMLSYPAAHRPSG